MAKAKAPSKSKAQLEGEIKAAVAMASTVDLVTCNLADFAAAVHAAIRGIGNSDTERYGDRKVFISAIFRALARAGNDVGSLDGFKDRLFDANRASLLELARADLVGAMPRATVAASEIADRGASFHFVLDGGARDAWQLAL